MTAHRVSVALPVYNGAKYLESSLQSILRSTYEDYEIIAVDDGSRDRSHAILAGYAERNPGRLIVHRFEQNCGMDIALNYAVGNLASGDYVARINQDDEMLQERLAQQVAFLDGNPEVVAVGGQMALMDASGIEFGRVNYPLEDKALRSRWMKVSPFGDPCVMYRKEAWEKTGGYNQNFWPADDLAMWFLMGRQGKLANIPDVVTRMRWHEGGGSFSKYRLMVRKQFAVRWWAWRSLRMQVSPGDFLFWVAQLAGALVFSPRFNWAIYRQIKRFIP